jgi:signal peptidase I
MLPTLKDGDKVLVFKHIPKHWLKKNEIVIIRPILKSSDPYKCPPYIKRIVGLQEDIVSISVNKYYKDKNIIRNIKEFYKLKIPNGFIYVQGDSQYSTDSREWGPISINNVIGIVIYKFSNQ